jgi:hypothetical protein
MYFDISRTGTSSRSRFQAVIVVIYYLYYLFVIPSIRIQKAVDAINGNDITNVVVKVMRDYNNNKAERRRCISNHLILIISVGRSYIRIQKACSMDACMC